jgi:hypothetical protein
MKGREKDQDDWCDDEGGKKNYPTPNLKEYGYSDLDII